jgi:K+/H+ antiporter YhaU regulatory subunit KhtT
MRKLKVGHERLPGIGDLFEIASASGLTVTVVAHRSGRRQLAVGEPDDDQVLITVALTRTEATALATLLTGAQIELITTPRA